MILSRKETALDASQCVIEWLKNELTKSPSEFDGSCILS